MFLTRRAQLTVFLAFMLLLHEPDLRAQAVQTADQRVRLHLYSMLSYTRTDYFGSGSAVGVVAGGTVDGIRVLPYFDLGLDLRGAMSHADVINLAYLAGGPRLSYSRFRLRPYAEYMLGVGRGTFNLSNDPTYLHDYTAISAYGGGFELPVTRNFGLRADVQSQRWRFTHNQPYFHPVQAGVGVTYRIHLHSRTGPQD